MSGFFEAVREADCTECGYPMATLRSDVSAVATLVRTECCQCGATGTIETRPEESVADETGVRYHGAATEADR